MKVEGNYTFNAPREVVWKALMDPEILSKVLPGCERLEQIGENEYKGVLNVRVGPVQGRFEGVVALLDIEPLEGYRMRVSGKGAPGFVEGEGVVRLEAQDSSTVLHYEGSAQLGGRLASVGQRLLDSTAKSLIRQGLEAFNQQISALAEAEKAGQPVPEVEAPTPTDFAAGVAKDMLAEMVPSERRSTLVVGGVALLIAVLLIIWLLNR